MTPAQKMQKTAIIHLSLFFLAMVLCGTDAAPLGSASRAVAHLNNDTLADLQFVCPAFTAELDIFLSTAGSPDGMRSTSGLAGKCTWAAEAVWDAAYTGPVNPWGVTTTNLCLPSCRLNEASKTEDGCRRRYTEYAVEPDAAIFVAPYCWHVQRVDDMAFAVSGPVLKGTRLYTALVQYLKALGSTFLVTENFSWIMSAVGKN